MRYACKAADQAPGIQQTDSVQTAQEAHCTHNAITNSANGNAPMLWRNNPGNAQAITTQVSHVQLTPLHQSADITSKQNRGPASDNTEIGQAEAMHKAAAQLYMAPRV